MYVMAEWCYVLTLMMLLWAYTVNVGIVISLEKICLDVFWNLKKMKM